MIIRGTHIFVLDVMSRYISMASSLRDKKMEGRVWVWREVKSKKQLCLEVRLKEEIDEDHRKDTNQQDF